MSHDCHECSSRPGSRLADGAAHDHDHVSWTRRQFLGTIGFATGALMIGRFPARALGQDAVLSRLAGVDTDRVLVILQLAGGNDGLNTLVPFRNDVYHNARPDLAVLDSFPVTDELGFHPAMKPLESVFKDGRMAILHSVGYDESKLSHFTGTDIWMTAGDSVGMPDDGWAGRFLDHALGERLLPYPMAIQLGDGAPLLFKGPTSQMAMSIRSMELFERLVTTGQLYDTGGLPVSELGEVVSFMRSVSNNLIHYADAVKTAYANGSNMADYPADNLLGEQLASIARLVRGGLETRIYHVTLNGFDTHARQPDVHADLLRQASGAMAAFYEDLAADELDHRVLGMTFSEFGRRVAQNSSAGTDHGTAAPLFLFGPAVAGGFHGTPPDLTDLDDGGNLRFETDYRAVYGTVLQRWFGLDEGDASAILGGRFSILDVV
ncbi:MAG: DUF1501 domain-containing protein [Rhodothermales bacterium]|nr:DUF1501 domain-containing protein [Rhodothermales bacterium]